MTDWFIQCCLMSTAKYFIHIQDGSILMNDDMNEPCFVLDQHAVLAQESNSLQEDIPLQPDTLF